MSLDKYQQIINKNNDVERTFEELPIEIYHRLAYLNFVSEDKDVEEIDKIFHFIAYNGSFFSQLTQRRDLAQWINFHVFYLKYEVPQMGQVKNCNQFSSALESAVGMMAHDLNMNIISQKTNDSLETILNLSQQLECKELEAAVVDLKLYIDNFDDMEGIVYLFQRLNTIASQVFDILKESNKN